MGGSTWRRFGPLAVHVIGMCCVLVMPVSVIFEVDMKYGFSDDPVHAPPITKGGFEHHGPVVAFFEIIGVSCLSQRASWVQECTRLVQRSGLAAKRRVQSRADA